MTCNIIKGTAPCPTRAIYLHPSVANLIWRQWCNTLSTSAQATVSINLPHGWQKLPSIADNIIKRCPFCNDTRPGDLEHLHLYCKSPILINAQAHCHEKIEYNMSSSATNRRTKLQQKLEQRAMEIEKQERCIVQHAHLRWEARASNIAIIGKQALTKAVLMQQVPAKKIQDYERFPLAYGIGMIHSIPEDHFQLATATIIDVGYLGLLPKGLIQVLQGYTQELKHARLMHEHRFMELTDKLIMAFIHRPITIQKTIQIMLAKRMKDLENAPQPPNNNSHQTTQYMPNNMTGSRNTPSTEMNGNMAGSTPSNSEYPPKIYEQKICYASKCQLLQAQGCLPRPMLCAPNKNMCAGCLSESRRHKKTLQLEKELLMDVSPYITLALLLAYRTSPISPRELRNRLQHLPTIGNNKGRDDALYGATRYTANTFGFNIDSANARDKIDPRPSEVESRRIWRMATFRCRCKNDELTQNYIQQFGHHTFCQTCKFLIYKACTSSTASCPACNVNEAWQENGIPCISCDLAAIVYKNSFQNRFIQQLDLWLAQEPTDSSQCNHIRDTRHRVPLLHTPKERHPTASQLLRWRNQSFEDSFQEIRSKATPQQTRIDFENLSVLQQSIQSNWALPKRPHHEDVSTLTQSTNETSTNASSNKKSSLSHPLSTEGTQLGQTTRQPLKPMDTNIPHIRTSHHNQKDNGSSTGISTTSKQNYRDQKRAER
jgi:hypothetical protein